MKTLNYDWMLTGCHPFSDIAMAYFSSDYVSSSVRAMRVYIRRHPDFFTELSDADFHKHDNVLTPLQIAIIVLHMGMPGEARLK